MNPDPIVHMLYPEMYGYRMAGDGLQFTAWYWTEDGVLEFVADYKGLPIYYPNIDEAYAAAKLAWEYLGETNISR